MSARDIFGSAGEYTVYVAELQVRELLVGGVPGDPSVIRKWIEARLKLGDALLQELAQETFDQRTGPGTVTEQVDAIMASPEAPSANGFKRLDTGELAYEGRCLKAALKEWANSSYPGTDWDGKKGTKGLPVKKDGDTAFKKGLMATLAERVFVDPYLIPLGVKAEEISPTPGVRPAWVEERIKHVSTPQGKRSAISRVEVIERPTVRATLSVRDDFLTPEAWARIWQVGEEIGIGADRGRSDGRFELVRWEKIR